MPISRSPADTMPKRLSERTRHAILFLHENNKSVLEIRRRLNIRRGTIHDIIKKFQLTDEIYDLRRSGRPRKTTRQQDRNLVRKSLSNRRSSVRQLQRATGTDLGISSATVHRRLKEAGLRSVVMKKKPTLTNRHKVRRLEWARDHVHWSIEDWRKVNFVDEAPFFVNRTVGRQFVRLRRGERSIEVATSAPAQKRGARLMVWGSISGDGVGPLMRICNTLNGERYEALLRELYDSGDLKGQYHLAQDNAPAHRSRRVKDLLQDLSVATFDWPPMSPDLNVIENVWSFVGGQLANDLIPVQARNQEDLLWRKINNIWNNMSADFIRTFVDSMPNRIEEVIRLRGGSTKY